MGVALVQLPADTFSGEVKEENEVEVSEEKSKVLYCCHMAILSLDYIPLVTQVYFYLLYIS